MTFKYGFHMSLQIKRSSGLFRIRVKSSNLSGTPRKNRPANPMINVLFGNLPTHSLGNGAQLLELVIGRLLIPRTLA
jgi:hypothetical protein